MGEFSSHILTFVAGVGISFIITYILIKLKTLRSKERERRITCSIFEGMVSSQSFHAFATSVLKRLCSIFNLPAALMIEYNEHSKRFRLVGEYIGNIKELEYTDRELIEICDMAKVTAPPWNEIPCNRITIKRSEELKNINDTWNRFLSHIGSPKYMAFVPSKVEKFCGIVIVPWWEKPRKFPIKRVQQIEIVGKALQVAKEILAEKNKLRQLPKILETIGGYGLISLDTNLNIVSWNTGAMIIFGYTEKEATKMNLKDLIAEKEWEKLKEVVIPLVSKGGEWSGTFLMRGKTRIIIYADIAVYPIKENEELTGYMFIIRDKTTETHITSSFIEKEKSLKLIMDNLNDAIVMVNPKGMIIQANYKAAELFGYNNANELVGKNILGIVRYKEKEILEDLLEKSKNPLRKRQLLVGDIARGNRWYNIRVSSWFEGTRYGGSIIIFMDITERKELINKLQDFRKRMIEDMGYLHKLQMRLLPSKPISFDGVRFDYMVRESEWIGGDLIYFRVVKNRYVVAAVYDVSGHGIRSAALTFLLKEATDEAINLSKKPEDLRPSNALKIVNSRFEEMQKGYDIPLSFTCFYVFIDTRTMTMVYTNAASPDGMLIRNGKEIRLKRTRTIFGGIIPVDEIAEKEMQLQQGDKIFFSSDGLWEFENENGQSFQGHLEKFFAETSNLSVDEIIEKLKKELFDFSQIPPRDDISVAGIEIVGRRRRSGKKQSFDSGKRKKKESGRDTAEDNKNN